MTIRYGAAVLTLIAGVAASGPASAHCDTLEGPIVSAARAALDAGDPNLVMHWVRPEDEATVKAAFQQTMEVRALGAEAKALADRYFFESLVRIHRAGEGAPYTGLTADDPEPIIAATDRALERGSAEELGHPAQEATAGAHARSELQRLPWILTGFLAVIALVEGAFLAKRRRQAPT